VAPPARTPVSDVVPGITFYEPVWKEARAAPDETTAADRRLKCVVFGDGELPDALVRDLRRQRDVVQVRRGCACAALDGSTFEIDPLQSAHYEQLFDEILQPGRLHVIVDLRQVGADEIEEPITAAFDSLVALARALGTRPTVEARVVVVTVNAQQVTGDELLRPECSMLSGPVLAAPLEFPQTAWRSIDIQPSMTDTSFVTALGADVLRANAPPTVAYRGARRWVKGFEPRDWRPSQPPSMLRDRGVYLILGGTGRIGLQIAEYLATTVRARLALASRRGWALDPPALDVLASIRQSDAELLVLRTDVCDDTRLRAAIEDVEADYGEIHGVMFAAGVNSHVPIAQIDRAATGEACRAHVLGLPALERVLHGRSLDFCLVISSIATVSGGPGLALHAAPHLFADAFVADHNRRESTTWTAIAFDAWSGDDSLDALARLLSARVPTGTVACRGDLFARIAAVRQTDGRRAVKPALKATRTANRRRSQSPSPLVRFGPATDVPPLFCVHPETGSARWYAGLAGRLAGTQAIVGIDSPAWHEGVPADRDIEDIAADYVGAVRSAQPEGPYWLAGWSAGGTIAFEMARQMEEEGLDVACVVLFDTVPPDAERSRAPDAGKRGGGTRWKQVAASLRRSGLLARGTPEKKVRRLSEIWRVHLSAAARYQPSSILHAPVTVMRARGLDGEARDGLDAWTKHASSTIEWIGVPGTHEMMFDEPGIATLATALAACLARARGRACITAAVLTGALP
jgi:thioesterase domain-containing protein/NADP-dependent 3-hydroxy acid dehydrogenase YdfG